MVPMPNKLTSLPKSSSPITITSTYSLKTPYFGVSELHLPHHAKTYGSLHGEGFKIELVIMDGFEGECFFAFVFL